MKGAYWRAVGIAACLLWASGAAKAIGEPNVEVKVRATVPIGENSLDMARSNAVELARRRCVEEALRSRFRSPAEFAKQTVLLERAFLTDPQPYLAEFVVEDHALVEGGAQYAVRATGKVRSGALALAMVEYGVTDVFQALASPPTLMVLVKERFETRVAGTRAAEAALVRLLRAKDLRVIDPEQSKLLELRERLAAEGAMDITNAARATLGFRADYLILGDAAVTSSAPLAGTDLKARMANLTLWLVETASGRVLGTETGAANARHLDELTGGNWALEDAVGKTGTALLARFEAFLRDQLQRGTEVVLDVHGLDAVEQAETVLAALRKLAGVVSAGQRFYYADTAQLEVRYLGETAALAAETRKLVVAGQPLSITEQRPRYVRAQRGPARALQAGAFELFRQFAAEKYRAFDFERAREQNAELIRQVNALAADQRVNDQQRKELHAARLAVEARDQELFHQRQQLQQRESALAACDRALEEARQALAAEQRRFELAAQNAQAAAAEASRRQAEERYAAAAQAAYVARQNCQSAADGASQKLAAAAQDIENLIRVRDGTANLIGVALRGLIR